MLRMMKGMLHCSSDRAAPLYLSPTHRSAEFWLLPPGNMVCSGLMQLCSLFFLVIIHFRSLYPSLQDVTFFVFFKVSTPVPIGTLMIITY